MSKEAIEIALEALEGSQDYKMGRDMIIEAAETLKEALANHCEDDLKMVKQKQCKYPNCDYPCMNLPDCQEQGEPVAWAHKEGLESISDFDASIYANGGFDNAIPLYATPQQRTWVGLTWNDVPDEWVGKVAFMEGAKWADKQLKEKNT